MGVGRQPQTADVHAAPAQAVELLDQHLGIDDHAVADHAGLARIEDPGRDQVELELVAVADDRVAGVVAALEAHHHLGALGEQVDDLALALVAPLGSDDHDSRHATGDYAGTTATRRIGCTAGPRPRAALADLGQARDDARADLLLELVGVEFEVTTIERCDW